MTLKECINIFIQMEKMAVENYGNVAKLVKDEDIKKIALALAEEEKKHMLFLGDMNKYTEVDDMVLNDEILEDISGKLSKNVQANSKNITTEKEFFIVALQKEQESIELYEKFKDLFKEDSEGYDLFRTLIAEEKKHIYVILNRLHELK